MAIDISDDEEEGAAAGLDQEEADNFLFVPYRHTSVTQIALANAMWTLRDLKCRDPKNGVPRHET